MEVHIEYVHLIKRKLRIGHLPSKGMPGHIVSSLVFSVSLTVLEIEEIKIPSTLLVFSVCWHPSLYFLQLTDGTKKLFNFKEVANESQPCLKDFISFFNEETVLVNDLVISREAISKYVENSEREGQKKIDQSEGYITLATEVSSHHEYLQEKFEMYLW